MEDFSSYLDLDESAARDAQLGSVRRIDGEIQYVVNPALAKQAEMIRAYNQKTADGVKWVINGVAIALALLVLALFQVVFRPMDRSIRSTLKNLTEALADAKSAERAKSEFLANMSHEIRTPMNGVLGMAELLAHTELNSRQKTFAEVIVKSGNALLTIINDILDFSKIEAGHIELDPAPFALREAVEDVATLISTRAQEKDLELIVRIAPDLPEHVVGDVGRIRQILTNLVGNGVKFTEQGHVLIEAKPEMDTIRFDITDTGIGIPEDKVALVFDKFSQVDASSTRRHEGTGLGLAITTRLVELMGGRIEARSELGVGSTFSFSIPLIPHGDIGSPTTASSDLRGKRVLIVDDNGVNRNILGELLGSWEIETCAVESGALALEFLRRATAAGLAIDAVILDYQMPGMHGGEVLAAIRQDPAIARTNVILLTSIDHALTLSELKRGGADAVLIKPARSVVLRDTLLSTMRGRTEAIDPQKEATAAVPKRNRFAPARPAKPTAPVGAAASNVMAGQPKQKRPAAAALDILVAEDNEVNQMVFRQILEGLGFAFVIVGDGKRAVASFMARKPSIILMDVSMPEMNGLEATKAIRAYEKEHQASRTPIIGVTAHALKGDRERCIDAGMDDYMTKPISPDKLASKVQDWISERKAAAA
jgi:signal transduction histidine kinase/DNA-binding response OmpR family regulator